MGLLYRRNEVNGGGSCRNYVTTGCKCNNVINSRTVHHQPSASSSRHLRGVQHAVVGDHPLDVLPAPLYITRIDHQCLLCPS
jgi:hypothetical protein